MIRIPLQKKTINSLFAFKDSGFCKKFARPCSKVTLISNFKSRTETLWLRWGTVTQKLFHKSPPLCCEYSRKGSFNLRNNAIPTAQHSPRTLRRRTIDGSVRHLRTSEPKLYWTHNSAAGRKSQWAAGWTSKHTVTKMQSRGSMPKCLLCTGRELWL